MRKGARKRAAREVVAAAIAVGLADLLRRDLRSFVVDAGVAALATLLERERTDVCGPRYAHQPGRRAHRAGHAEGQLVLGGRRVTVRRPRARGQDGEIVLPSWAQFGAEDPLHDRALEQMLVGVSTRRYARSLEPVPSSLPTRGTSRSAVSRRFVESTQAQMTQWLGRDLSAVDLAALMIDGVHIAEHVILVALGIDAEGKKHVLGLREGATENAVACRELLDNLQERGMRADRSVLVVIDGSKALSKAVRHVFGARALVQRCQAHKRRNVIEHLPESMRTTISAVLSKAYAENDAARARKMLLNVVRRLRDQHPGAAASLEEGLDETLTVKHFGLPEWLERTLSTTNAIENLIGSVRDLGRRVKRWRDGSMILRWTAAAVVDASKRFRKLRGHVGMKKLLEALRAHDAALEIKSKAA